MVLFFIIGMKFSYAANPLDSLKSITDTALGLFKKDNVPKTVAVLPFTGQGTDEDKKELRITFNNHISSKKFENIKLDEIDEKLAILEKETGKKWSDFDNITLAKKLGVDGLFYVEVLGIEKVYAGVYGSLSIKVKARLVSAENGELIWEKEDSVAERSGGVPLSPWGAISTAISSALVLRDTVKISLMDKLFREMAKSIPEPKVAAVRKPPVIFSVVTNAKDSPFKLGSEILVAVKGESGCIASFEIPEIAKGIPLTEIEPGNYVGKYIVKEGDNGKNKLMKANLFSPKTKLENIYTIYDPIEIDTIPPKEVKNLQIMGLKDKVKITWDKSDDAKDYFIQRSETGDFVDIGITQVNEFYDESAVIGKTYFYRVYARDPAGNLSRHVESKFYYIKKGPTDIGGTISENSVLYKDASPYIVKSDIFILKGVEVVAEPGVVIEFDNNTELKVSGRLILNGNEKNPITIKGKNYKIVVLDAGDNSLKVSSTVFEGGKSIIVSNSSISFNDVKISNFETGILLERNGKIFSKKSIIKHSNVGIFIENGLLEGEYILENNEIGLHYADGFINTDKLIFGFNKRYLQSQKSLSLSKVTINDQLIQELFSFISGISSNVDIQNVSPINKSFRDMKKSLFDQLMLALINSISKGDIESIKTNVSKIESIFYPMTFSNVEFFAYVYSRYISYDKALNYIDKSELKFKEILNEYLNKGKKSAIDIKIDDMKASTMQISDNLEEMLAQRLRLKAVREIVDELIPDMDRNKLQEIDKKILVNASKYVLVIYPITTISTEINASVYYMYAINKGLLLEDLKTYGIIGSDKKNTKIGLVFCNINLITDEVRKLIRKHKFEFIDLKYEICDISNYYPKAKEAMADLLILIKSDTKQIPSTLGSNLNLFSSNIEIKMANTFLEKDFMIITEGGTSYHINEEEGKKAAYIDAYNKISGKLEKEILLFEKNYLSDEIRIKAKAKYISEKTEEPVVVSVLKSYNIFVNQYKSYSDNPVLEISIKNNTNKTINNIKYSLYIKNYMDFPTEDTLESIEPGKIAVVKLKAVFNNRLLELTENTKLQAELKLKYVLDGKLDEVRSTASLNIFEKNALVWDDKRKLSTFITPRDPNILDLSRLIVNNIPKRAINNNISVGVAVFELLKTYGIKYQQDPNSPYSTVSGNAEVIDYVQYPTDTLKRKTGDCDDLVALLASLFESLGIKTAFVDVPGHIFLLFDSGISSSEDIYYGFKKEDFVEYNSKLYIPIETTMINASFLESWKNGVNLYKKFHNKNLNIIFTEKGWELYKPPTFEPEKLKLSIPYNFQSSYISSYTEIIKIRDNNILQNLKNTEYKPENTLYRLFINGMIDDAIHISSIILNTGYKTPQFLNDTGNLYFYTKNYKEALDFYKKAFEISNNYVYINNIIATYEKIFDKKNADFWKNKLSELQK